MFGINILYIKANVVSVCLFMWTKIGQCLEDSSSHYSFPVEHLMMIIIIVYASICLNMSIPTR
jgi:hypothetical protein